MPLTASADSLRGLLVFSFVVSSEVRSQGMKDNDCRLFLMVDRNCKPENTLNKKSMAIFIRQ